MRERESSLYQLLLCSILSGSRGRNWVQSGMRAHETSLFHSYVTRIFVWSRGAKWDQSDETSSRFALWICGGCYRLAHPLSFTPTNTAVVNTSKWKFGDRANQLSRSGSVWSEHAMRLRPINSRPRLDHCGWICTNVAAHYIHRTITIRKHYASALSTRTTASVYCWLASTA